MINNGRDRLVWAFGLSIGLNLAFAGWWGARTWRHSQASHVAQHRGRSTHSRHLPQDAVEATGRDRGQLEKQGKEQSRVRGKRGRGHRRGGLSWLSPADRQSLRAQNKLLKQSRQQAETLLRAENFDAGGFAAHLEQLRLKNSGIQREVHRLLLKEAEDGSVTERRELAERSWAGFARGAMSRGGKRGRRHKRQRKVISGGSSKNSIGSEVLP